MADWRDGAQYAPHERPDGFATPRTSPLSVAEPEPNPAAGQPLQGPDSFAPDPTPAPPLEALVPSAKPSRDPREAFSSGSVAHDAGAWGAAHSGPGTGPRAFDPTAPMVTTSTSFSGQSSASSAQGAASNDAASWAPPDQSTQFAPPAGAPVAGVAYPPGGPAPLAWNQQPQGPVANGSAITVVQCMGYGLILVLLAGLIIRPLSLVLLLVAIPLSLMAKIGKQHLMRMVSVAAAVVLVLGIAFPGQRDTLDAIGFWSQIACLIVLPAGLFTVWSRMMKGQS